MPVTADTIRLITQGEYTIGATGTIPESDFEVYLQWAQDQFVADSPGNHTPSQADQAVALLVCHYIDRGQNDQRIDAEDAGDGSTSYDNSGSNWMKSYLVIIASLVEKLRRDISNPSGTYKHPSKGAVRTSSGHAAGAMPSSFSR